jgi:hypothetical protein
MEGDVTCQDLMSLIKDIMESIDNTQNSTPVQVTQFSDEILVVEFGEQRFRITIEDTKRFQ